MARRTIPDPDPAQLKRFGFTHDVWNLLLKQVYPSASDPSVVYHALERCKLEDLDPFSRPFAIVGMYDTSAGRYIDTLWDTIGYYRIRAHRTGVYAGKSEAVFGPSAELSFDKNETFEYPEYATVTVRRSIGTSMGEWSEKIFFREAYARASRETGKPNSMWGQRPHQMLAKCAEAAALRAAFPELNLRYTADEMEGHVLESGTMPDQKVMSFVSKVIERCKPEGQWHAGRQLLNERLADGELVWALRELDDAAAARAVVSKAS